MSLFTVLEEVARERERQDAKWGHPQMAMQAPAHALAILAEEFGEASKAVVEFLSYPPDWEGERLAIYRGVHPHEYWLKEIRKELIQTAAVAVSFIEHMDGES